MGLLKVILRRSDLTCDLVEGTFEMWAGNIAVEGTAVWRLQKAYLIRSRNPSSNWWIPQAGVAKGRWIHFQLIQSFVFLPMPLSFLWSKAGIRVDREYLARGRVTEFLKCSLTQWILPFSFPLPSCSFLLPPPSLHLSPLSFFPSLPPFFSACIYWRPKACPAQC